MTTLSHTDKSDAMHDKAVAELVALIGVLTTSELALVKKFVSQMALCHDPDIVEEFLQWREDPRIGTILHLASEIGNEQRDQLLFAAEDLFKSCHLEARDQITGDRS